MVDKKNYLYVILVYFHKIILEKIVKKEKFIF